MDDVAISIINTMLQFLDIYICVCINGELKIRPSPVRPYSCLGPKRLTQHKKIIHRQEVVRGCEGYPSGKQLEGLSKLRKFSKWVYVQKLIMWITFYYFEV